MAEDKRTNNGANPSESERMKQEYDLDYGEARPNRFADLPGEHSRLVFFDPDSGLAEDEADYSPFPRTPRT